jgi:Rrf2 family nitric oxide-sensitive transcriptional repressor
VNISHTAEYALRAVVWLAAHAETAVGTAQIAQATNVPPGYMSKVLQFLARARLVTSSPGRIGGFRLARPPEEISVLDVINAVDRIGRIERCPLGLRAHEGNLCPLHRRLDRALALVEEALAQSTIAEMVADSPYDGPLCDKSTPNGANASHARSRKSRSARKRSRRSKPRKLAR